MSVATFPARALAPSMDREEFVHAVERAVEEAARDGAAALGVATDELGLSGGKRIRSRLAYECASALAGDVARVVPVAAAVEMVHAASLCHDDVIDQASLRRGRPTLNQRFGNQRSVLVGDYLFSSAWLVVDAQPAVASLLAEAVAQMSRAELLQARLLWNPDPGVDACYAVVRGKTAALFSACAAATALALDAPRETVAAFRTFGLGFGMAFQLLDDVLDYGAGDGALGKEPLMDLRSGLVTLPLAHALAMGKGAGRQAVLEHFQSRGARALDARLVVELLRATEALGHCRRTAGDLVAKAVAALAGHVPVAGLAEFAQATLARTF
jgi:octaprenyl-diphosphate synthase